MGSTQAEKILAAHAGLDEVRAGQFIDARVDLVLSNDITAPIAIREFERLGVKGLFDPERVVMVADHFAPNKDIKSAEQCLTMRRFAHQQRMSYHYDVGRMGIEHVLLPEQGLVVPGDVVVGADSHTCTYGALGAFATGMGSTDIAVAMATGRIWMRVPETIRFEYQGALKPWVGGKDLILHTIGLIGVSGARYKAMEFTGPTIEALPMADRFTMANMAIEAGAKTGLFAVDEETRAYVETRARRPYSVYQSDPDAHYAQVVEIDAGQIEPQVAFPHLPENVRPVSQAGEVEIDQAVRGAAGPPGASRCALHRHSWQPAGLPGRPARGAGGDLYHRRGGGQHADLRPLPGRPHGRVGRWRAGGEHHQPQLPGANGRPGKRGLSVQPGGRRRLGGGRAHRRPRGGDVMTRRGKAWKYGDNVDTDVIIPARYLNVSTAQELALHCMEDLDPSFAQAVQPGDVIVAGENFGCGSSREHAPSAIKGAGVRAVVARSFARIFYRNAINVGLPILESPAAAEAVESGHELEIDLEAGRIRNVTTGETYQAEPYPPFMMDIINAGGLVPYTRQKLESEG